MNGRVNREDTPEGRLAAVARSAMMRITARGREADYADFREALRPFVRRELLYARVDEARKCHAIKLTERMRELDREMIELAKQILLIERQIASEEGTR